MQFMLHLLSTRIHTKLLKICDLVSWNNTIKTNLNIKIHFWTSWFYKFLVSWFYCQLAQNVPLSLLLFGAQRVKYFVSLTSTFFQISFCIRKNVIIYHKLKLNIVKWMLSKRKLLFALFFQIIYCLKIIKMWK